MKKVFSLILCLALLLGLAVTAMAASPTVYMNFFVYFTSSSEFVAGGTVTVDESKILNDGNITAEVYNAILEGRVTYSWIRNDSEYAKGKSITLTESDKGCRFYCEASVYEDAGKTQKFGVFFSEDFFVPNTGNPALIPEITTKNLPEGTVGQDYYFKLECTDPDVTYSLFRSSLPEGLYLTQHGEIEGAPTKAGSYYVVIMATPVELGEDYATTAEFELKIVDDYCELEIMREPNKWLYQCGETLDLTGMWVRIYTSEGYLDSYDGEYLSYPTDPLKTVGDRKIKVSYKDAFAIFLVVVEPAPTDATEPTTETTETTTEATQEATVEATVDATVEATNAPTVGTEDPQTTVPPETLDGPGSEGVDGSSNDHLVLWVCLGAGCFVVLVAAAVVVILVLTKRKKAA